MSAKTFHCQQLKSVPCVQLATAGHKTLPRRQAAQKEAQSPGPAVSQLGIAPVLAAVRSCAQSLILAAAVSSFPLLALPSAFAAGLPNEIPEAGAEVVAGTETVLQQQNETISRETQQKDKIFLALKVDNEEKGRVVVALYNDVPTGAQRFAELAEGKQGAELTSGSRPHIKPGMVSLVVRDSKPRAVNKRLTAYNGKLITVEEQVGDTSNGTGFNITLQAAPELDYTSLAVGEVVEGLPIIQSIAKLPAVRSQSNSAFFK
ncbi:hypothetical protein MMC29_003628 [Sticta canariensis]|nr:hypothetical protein [Sticta canariensis]